MRVDLLGLKRGGVQWRVRCVTQPFPAGGFGGQRPGGKRILSTIY